MLEVLLATKVLPVGVLNPLRHDHLIGEVEGVLQIVQSNHQADGYTGSALAFGVECAEALSGRIPINRASEFDQAVSLINQIDQFSSKQLVFALKLCDFRPHHFPRFRLPLIRFMTI